MSVPGYTAFLLSPEAFLIKLNSNCVKRSGRSPAEASVVERLLSDGLAETRFAGISGAIAGFDGESVLLGPSEGPSTRTSEIVEYLQENPRGKSFIASIEGAGYKLVVLDEPTYVLDLFDALRFDEDQLREKMCIDFLSPAYYSGGEDKEERVYYAFSRVLSVVYQPSADNERIVQLLQDNNLVSLLRARKKVSDLAGRVDRVVVLGAIEDPFSALGNLRREKKLIKRAEATRI